MNTLVKSSFGTICLVLLLSSCGFGPKPDKIIDMSVEFSKENPTNQEFDSVIEVLYKRLQKIAKKTEIIREQEEIRITATTHYSTERFKKCILNSGELEFYETLNLKEKQSFLMELRDSIKEKDTTFNPILDLIANSLGRRESLFLYVAEKDTTLVKEYLVKKVVEFKLLKGEFPVKFMWGMPIPMNGINYYNLYAVKPNKIGKPALHGDVIKDAFMTYAHGRPVISIEMNQEGAKKWEDLTGKAGVEGFNIAIALNTVVYSAPQVYGGAIKGGKSQISGDFTQEEAVDFANILVSGSIPKLKLVAVDFQRIN